MAEIKAPEKPTVTAIPTPEKLKEEKDVNYSQLVSLGVATCKKCGSKKTTDLDGNVKCYHDQKDCPFL